MPMSKSKNLAEHVTRVQTYAELAAYAQAFADGHLNLLFVFGDAGLGKSQCLHGAVGERVCWINGTATPFGVYCAAYEHRDLPIVLDDLDGLHRDRQGVRLLKSLCQTDAMKRLTWQTDAASLVRRGIPREFTTTSRVAIIGNQWNSLNADVAALEDRGHFLVFEPTAVEVHRQAAAWFWDQEVYDLVAANLHLMERPSLRTYVLAYERKRAGLDWQASVLSRCLSGVALAVAKLKANPSFASEEDRAKAFVASGIGCRATYFNHAKRIRSACEVPKIVLSHSEPPQSSAAPADILALLRRQFGHLGNG